MVGAGSGVMGGGRREWSKRVVGAGSGVKGWWAPGVE